jgi:hypothetical protein
MSYKPYNRSALARDEQLAAHSGLLLVQLDEDSIRISTPDQELSQLLCRVDTHRWEFRRRYRDGETRTVVDTRRKTVELAVRVLAGERKRRERDEARWRADRELIVACVYEDSERREQLAETLRPFAQTDKERASIDAWVRLGGDADTQHWHRVAACGHRRPA